MIRGFGGKEVGVDGLWGEINNLVSFRIVAVRVNHLSPPSVIECLFVTHVHAKEKPILVGNGLVFRIKVRGQGGFLASNAFLIEKGFHASKWFEFIAIVAFQFHEAAPPRVKGFLGDLIDGEGFRGMEIDAM